MAKHRLFRKLTLRKEALLIPLFLMGLAVLTALTTYLTQDEKTGREALVENSIYNGGPSGYKAWFLTAQKAGLPVKVWESGFDELNTLPLPSTVLIVKPFTVAGSKIVFGHKEADQLLDWVARGNNLVLLDDFSRTGSNAIAHRVMLNVRREVLPSKKQNTDAPPPPPRPLRLMERALLNTYVSAPLLSQSHISLHPQPDSGQFSRTAILAGPTGKTRLWRLNYKGGTLILGTVTDLAENRYLNTPENDNYQLLTNLLRSGNAPIYINEFVHGYMETGDLTSYFQKKTPLGSIFAQLVLFFMMLLWLSFVRWTPKPRETDESLKHKTGGGGQAAYLESLAGLYFRSKSPTLALGPQLRQLETILRKRFRIGLDEDARLLDLLTTLFANYSNSEDSPAALLDAVKKARRMIEQGDRHSHRDLLKLSRQLSVIEERLRHGNRKLSSYR